MIFIFSSQQFRFGLGQFLNHQDHFQIIQIKQTVINCVKGQNGSAFKFESVLTIVFLLKAVLHKVFFDENSIAGIISILSFSFVISKL